MPAYRQTDQLFVTCVAGRKNYVSTIISGGEIGVNRKRKQGDLRGRRSPCFSLDLKLFGSDAPAFSLLVDGGEAPVQTVLLHELGVRAVLGDPAVCHDEDLVGVLDGREAVGDGDDRLAARQLGDGLLDEVLVLRADARGGLVENDDGRVFETVAGELAQIVPADADRAALRVSSRGYMLGCHDLKDPSVSGFFRFLARVGDNRMRMQIVRLKFGEQ